MLFIELIHFIDKKLKIKTNPPLSAHQHLLCKTSLSKKKKNYNIIESGISVFEP